MMADAMRAQTFHRRKRRLQHAVERALPAGMGGADHPRFRVGEQDHAAVGAGDAERKARRRGDEAIALRPLGERRRSRPARRPNGSGSGTSRWLASTRRRFAMRRRFSATASGASLEPTPPLRLA